MAGSLLFILHGTTHRRLPSRFAQCNSNHLACRNMCLPVRTRRALCSAYSLRCSSPTKANLVLSEWNVMAQHDGTVQCILFWPLSQLSCSLLGVCKIEMHEWLCHFLQWKRQSWSC